MDIKYFKLSGTTVRGLSIPNRVLTRRKNF